MLPLKSLFDVDDPAASNLPARDDRQDAENEQSGERPGNGYLDDFLKPMFTTGEAGGLLSPQAQKMAGSPRTQIFRLNSDEDLPEEEKETGNEGPAPEVEPASSTASALEFGHSDSEVTPKRRLKRPGSVTFDEREPCVVEIPGRPEPEPVVMHGW